MGRIFARLLVGAFLVAFVGMSFLMAPEDAEAISPQNKKALSGWVGPYALKYTDFQNDAGIKQIAETTAYATMVEDIYVKVDTAFARAGIDGGPSAVTLSLGKSGAVTNYKAATTVYTGASDISGGTFRKEAAGVAINGYLLTTGQNAAQLTAGKARVYLKMAEVSDR